MSLHLPIATTLILCSLVLTTSGCAGPATPLGAPWATSSSDVRNGPLSFIASLFRTTGGSVRFSPPRQVLHGPHPLTITISDPRGVRSNYRLVVRHNGLDVTSSFLRQADVAAAGSHLTIRVPIVRLPAARDHLIEVIYEGAGNFNAYARYQAPICRIFDTEARVARTANFTPGTGLVSLIQKSARARGFSPAFIAALVAQESGFNPRTVSWAKAIGLTQITPLAEGEIIPEFADWPRYPGINELPALFVKALVASGRVNPENEWRVDTARSLDGGLAFARLLAQRWSSPENNARIRQTFENPDDALTRLVLASYNSGYARVAAALARLGTDWLAAGELTEARKYVNRIESYCDYFSSQEVLSDEDAT